jgi:hypothetical protein
MRCSLTMARDGGISENLLGEGKWGTVNVSWAMEFLTCWVLKSNVFGLKSTVVK